MIIEQTGNILDSTCPIIVIPVNTMGVMGKGLAKQVKEKYPDVDRLYVDYCKNEEYFGGHCFSIKQTYPSGKKREFIMFATKEDWKQPSKIEWIEKGLDHLNFAFSKTAWYGITTNTHIAIPPLGCGLGGLNWDDVYPLIQKYLGNIEGLTVHVYLPR